MCRNTVVFVEIFICFSGNFNTLVLRFVSRLKTSIETRNIRFFTFVFSVKRMISVILILVVAMNQDIFFDAQNKVLLIY